MNRTRSATRTGHGSRIRPALARLLIVPVMLIGATALLAQTSLASAAPAPTQIPAAVNIGTDNGSPNIDEFVTFTADVTGAYAPTGSISFRSTYEPTNATSYLCTGVKLSAAVLNGKKYKATAICMASFPEAGTYDISPIYSGDDHYVTISGTSTKVAVVQEQVTPPECSADNPDACAPEAALPIGLPVGGAAVAAGFIFFARCGRGKHHDDGISGDSL